MSILQSWHDYHPTKGVLVWTAVGASVLTMVVGFTWGGWVTGGTAQQRVEEAAAAERAQLASSVCVERFRTLETARIEHQELMELMELSSYRRRQFLEEAEWSALPGGEPLGRQAATLCAQTIAEIDPESLPSPVAVVGEPETDAETSGSVIQ